MERIKAYFEEQIKTDEALKAVYSEDKLKGCWEYIKDQVRKQAKNGYAMIEDAVVYHWARDYMLGDVPEAKAVKVEGPHNSPEPEGTELPKYEEEPAEFKTDEEAEESEKTCGDCGMDYQDKCQQNGSTPVEASSPACSDFVATPTEQQIEEAKQNRLVIESVEQEETLAPKKNSKKEKQSDSEQQWLFDFE